MPDLNALPIFCAHEHWGSIYSIGPFPGGWRADLYAGATPSRRTTLLDLVLDPYLDGWVRTSGQDPKRAVCEALRVDDPWQGAVDRPAQAFRAVRPALRNHLLSGVLQCTRRGIMRLYDVDILKAGDEAIAELDGRIGRNYGAIFDWYGRAMREARFSDLIRPVHPEFYTREESAEAARAERAVTGTIMRIDSLLELWKPESDRRETMADMTGIDPGDASSWRALLDKLFEIAAQGGTTGIKQLQAYSRSLDFQERGDGEVRFRGDLTRGEVLVFQDWVMHECSKRAHDRGWPHQVHTGTHNHPRSNPMPLERLARRYPRQKLVLLHCWPYLEESAYLAQIHPNVYLDTCWQPILNTEFLREALRLWLGYVPTSKITMSNDATSVEMAVGASLYTRESLARALEETAPEAGLDAREMTRIAADMLHNNAAGIYGAKKHPA